MSKTKLTCVDWMRLLGRTTEDVEFVKILKQNGLSIPRDGGPNKDIDGMTMSFGQPDGLRDKIATTQESTVAFYGMMVHLADLKLEKNHYTGPLPFKLKASDSLEKLTEKLGPHQHQNRKDARFRWEVDRLWVVAFFPRSQELETLKAVSFVLPYAR